MGVLKPGTHIDARYLIIGPLGAGGMGVVYRARDEKLGRQVALKTLARELIGSDKARARLKREARSAAGLEHPGIAQVYDVGETEDGGAYLVLELIRGRSLRELMRADELDRDTLLRVIREIGSALDHAHERGVIHRDIKPDNVMLREDGRACLLDFGLAKALSPATEDTLAGDTPTMDAEHLTKEGALVGTLSYLAPEQARGKDVGPKSDQFALATMSYEALTGQLPWDGQNAAAVLAQILLDDAPAPSSLEGSLPIATDRVFSRALSKDPADRYPGAGAFARALSESFDLDFGMDGPPARALAEQAAQTDPPPATPQRPSPPPKRDGESGAAAPGRRWAAVAAAAGGLLAAALAAGLLLDRPSGLGPDAGSTTIPDDAIIACPIQQASGVPEPSSWLGAMAAHQTCDRLTYWLGGDPARTRTPAQLEGLPRVATDAFPEDPWIAEGAQRRSESTARRAEAWITGRVARTATGSFLVTLELWTAAADEPLATARGEDAALHRATAAATDALAGSGRLPVRKSIDEAVAPWLGTSSVQLAMSFHYDLGHGMLSGIGGGEVCERLAERSDELGSLRGEVQRACTRLGVDSAAALEPLALDRSSPATLALTASEQRFPEPEARAIAAELAAARQRAQHPMARATLAKGEIMILEQLGDMDQARDLLLTAARELPRDWFIRVHLVRAMLRTEGAYTATRALAAWSPDRAESWRTLALPLGGAERSIPWLRRAYLTGGALPLYGIYLSKALLRARRREEVRPIAARYATAGRRERVAGEFLRARIEMTEARFGRAFDRLLAVLIGQDQLGLFLYGDTDCVELLMQLASMLGREAEAADPLARRFILAEPHRLVVDQPHYELPAIAVCARASNELAGPCLARLRSLREARRARAGRNATAEALMEGAERYIEHDWDAAARAWRPLVRRQTTALFPEAFERAGQLGLLDRLISRRVRHTEFAGISAVHPLAARRAAAGGDPVRARALAEATVRAWGTADVDVPAVDEMRRLLSTLPD